MTSTMTTTRSLSLISDIAVERIAKGIILARSRDNNPTVIRTTGVIRAALLAGQGVDPAGEFKILGVPVITDERLPAGEILILE